MKKLILILIAAAVLMAENVYGQESNDYEINYEKDIEKMKENFFDKYENDEYATRAGAVYLLTNVYDINVQYDYTWDKDYVSKVFSDVTINERDDIYPDTKDYNAVYNGLKLGVIRGEGDNLFRPDELITKEDLYVMLYNVIKSDKIKTYECSDMDADINILNSYSDGNYVSEYAKVPVAFFIEQGLITGSIDPKDNVTNREMLDTKNKVYGAFKRTNEENYITRIEALEGLNDYSFSGRKEYLSASDYTNYSPFADMCSTILYSERGAVNFGIKNKIVSGYADGTFDPEGFITREDLCTMLYNLITSDTIDVFDADTEKYKYDVSDIEAYKDHENVNEYARLPIAFFMNTDVISDKGGNICPKEYVTVNEYENMKNKISEKFGVNG